MTVDTSARIPQSRRDLQRKWNFEVKFREKSNCHRERVENQDSTFRDCRRKNQLEYRQ